MSTPDRVGRAAAGLARLFYRLELAGERPPATGPLLVVTNHPNSLLDPALVTLAVGRPARFLAKATLFGDPRVGWLVRASGAIPVHRQQDGGTGGTRTTGNAAMFEAAESALAAGDAIALFPEGISHARPALAPLKTGAARLALGTAHRLNAAFPIVPVGITLDDRGVFRSTGLVVVGAPIPWDDLAAAVLHDGADPADDGLPREAVHALTRRIDDALHTVTASYASWEDARLIAAADQLHAAATEAARLRLPGASPPGATAPPDRLARHHLGATLLAHARTADGAAGDDARSALAALARAIRGHDRLLGVLGLTPADLAVPTDLRTAAGWTRRRLWLALAAALAALGTVVGWPPYRLTGIIAPRIAGPDEPDVLATAKALVGAAAFLAWTLLLAALAGWLVAWWAAFLVVLVVPPLLLLALVAGEGWRAAWRDARRFFLLRRHADRMADLRSAQATLARQIERVVHQLESDT